MWKRLLSAWKDDFALSNIDLSYALASLKWVCGTLAALFLSFPLACQALAVFVLLDWGSGVLAALKERRLCSDRGFDGLIRKSAMIVLVMAGYALTKFLKLDYEVAGVRWNMGSLLAVVYTCNEAISITENCARTGLWVPPWLLDAMIKAKNMAGQDRKREDAANKLRFLAKDVAVDLKTTAAKTAGKLIETAENLEGSSGDPLPPRTK